MGRQYELTGSGNSLSDILKYLSDASVIGISVELAVGIGMSTSF